MTPIERRGGVDVEATYALHCGDCREVMAGMDAESVDAIVSDPPYGLGFMGCAWDHGVPGVPFWTEALRVAKPGAHLLAFGGSRTFHRLTCAVEDAGWEIRDCLMWLYGSGFPKSHNLDGQSSGWGTALKPAYEPIILARKPLRGTVARNVQTFGTGAINVDGCRVASVARPLVVSDRRNGNAVYQDGLQGSRNVGSTDLGRWPANILLDDAAAAVLDAKSGESVTPTSVTRGGKRGGQSGMATLGAQEDAPCYGDRGGASRFFYTSKASGKDRGREEHGNDHPTVKPTDLMRWLCRLVTPPSGRILDPFMGSGSTGVAAVAEGFRFVGVDIERHHVEIAERRLAGAARQPGLFG